MTRTSTVWSMTAVLAMIGPMSASPRPQPDGVQQFNGRVAEYVALHRRVEQTVPPPGVTSDAREICEAVDAMANAMRAARSAATIGDIFTPEVAVEFRRRLAQEIDLRSYDPVALIAQIKEDAAKDQVCEDVAPMVNRSWSCGFAMTPPFVLAALPLLPVELQYRLIGSDLVLMDTHAGLVVDILRNALPLG